MTGPFGLLLIQTHRGTMATKNTEIAFILVVDYLAVNYMRTENLHHLRNSLIRSYKITTGWGGIVYSGMTLKWDYQKRTCDLSMPGCVTKVATCMIMGG